MSVILKEENKPFYTDLFNSGTYIPSVSARFYDELGSKNNDFVKQNKILDFGCGDGTGVMIGRKSGLDVYGVDIAENQKIWEKNGIGEYCISYDGIKTTYKDKEFGLITCLDTMEHILPLQTENVLKEILRLGKNFVFSIPLVFEKEPAYGFIYCHINIRSADDWVNLFLVMGFTINIVRELIITGKKGGNDEDYRTLIINASDGFPEIIIDDIVPDNCQIIKEFDVRKYWGKSNGKD